METVERAWRAIGSNCHRR